MKKLNEQERDVPLTKSRRNLLNPLKDDEFEDGGKWHEEEDEREREERGKKEENFSHILLF